MMYMDERIESIIISTNAANLLLSNARIARKGKNKTINIYYSKKETYGLCAYLQYTMD